MADRVALRLSATLLLIGWLLTWVAQIPHPGSPTPTDQAQFAAYAASSGWTAIHLGQFVATLVTTAGTFALYFALNISGGAPRWLAFFAAVAAGVALALAAVVFAVDGVALKQAVDAWAGAPPAEQAARFASAEALRWLETGARSYQELVSGLALALFAVAIAWTGRVPRPIGYLMGVSGLALVEMGWLAGSVGLTTPTRSILFEIGGLLTLVWNIWLLVAAWRMREVGHVAAATTAPK